MIHLPYGGSSAKRTINCPGWLKASEGITPRPAGAAAIEGSMHHEVMEACQKTDTVPSDHLGLVYKENGTELTFDEDHLDLSNTAFDFTNALLEHLDIDTMIIEPFVQLVPGTAGGSIDLLGLSADEKTLLILDYKFGAVKVSPIESEQHGCYGVSAMEDPTTADLFKKVEKVVFTIVQPKVKGVCTSWETDIKWLKAFKKKFLAAMMKEDINPGSHCKYCPAEPYCEAKRLNVVASNLLGSRVLEELQAGADVIVEVEDWLKSMKEEMYLQLNRGVPLKGWKIIDKRATRKWKDENEASKCFADIIGSHKTTLVTPPQMEKLIKKNKVEIDLNEFIISESSGTTLAAADHASPAVIVSDVQGHLKDIME
tara:strand:+ start:1577 stop:2686 length:1110 start_codon:yes stop_codon:yes gene_type:complete